MLEKKSSLYSERPIFPMAVELVDWRGIRSPTLWRQSSLEPQEPPSIIGTPTAVKVHDVDLIEEFETRRFLKCVFVKLKHIRQYGY